MESRIRAANDQLLNRGNVEKVPRFFADDYVLHGSEGDLEGREVIADFISELRGAFPDLHVEVEVLATEDDRVAWVRRHHGTHEGDFMGVEATGERLVWQDMVVTRFQDDLIAEEWGASELAGKLLEQ